MGLAGALGQVDTKAEPDVAGDEASETDGVDGHGDDHADRRQDDGLCGAAAAPGTAALESAPSTQTRETEEEQSGTRSTRPRRHRKRVDYVALAAGMFGGTFAEDEDQSENFLASIDLRPEELDLGLHNLIGKRA